jgi:hypothetical protein
MSFAFGSTAQRKLIIARARAQLLQGVDSLFLASLPFSAGDDPKSIKLKEWNKAFGLLNEQYWNGDLPKISVYLTEQKDTLGLYWHGSSIHIATNKNMSAIEMLGVLLHEMVHHWVEVTYGHGVNAANGGKRVIGHGKEWKREMKRVGYTGKISRFTGLERFTDNN